MTDAMLKSLGPGTTLGELFAIEQRIGRGGMGDVFLAKDLVLDRKVAVKAVRPNLAKRVEVDASFRREARFLSQLNHPNIVTIHSFGHLPPDLHYIVMEYVEGEPIESLLKRQGVLSPGFFCGVLAQLSGALTAAHALGIVHQDLKPANILVTSISGNPHFVKVLDFGLARVFGHNKHDLEGELKFRGGTPSYMSPEHVLDKDVDARSDVYSLAVLCCELLTGKFPISGSDMLGVMKAQVKMEPTLPSELRPDLGIEKWGELDKVFEQALNKHPDARHQSVEEFTRALLPAVLRWAGLEEHPPPLAIPYLSQNEFPLSDSQELAFDRTPNTRNTLYTLLDTEQLTAGLEAGRHLRNISVLEFGFSQDPYNKRVDLDEYMECLHLVRNRIAEAVGRQSGFVLGPLTHGQQALFGLYSEGENSSEAAVEAALEIQALLKSLKGDPAIPHDLEFNVRMGIDTGEILLSENSSGSMVVHGGPVFRAHELQLTDVDGVVISRAVARRLRNRYQLEDLSGSPDSSLAYRVLRKRQGVAGAQVDAIHGLSIDFFGREKERLAAYECYKDVCAKGHAHALLVQGATGLGKGRLISQFLRDLSKEDPRPRIEFGRCSSQQDGHPYEPFADILRHQIDLNPDDNVETAQQKIGHFVRIFLNPEEDVRSDERETLVWLISLLLGRDQGQDAKEDIAAHNALLFSMLIKMFERMTEDQPTVVYIRDLQWATDATRQLLGLIIERVYDRPLLFVLSERNSDQDTPPPPFVREENQLSLIQLAPLDKDECTELVRHSLRRLVEVPSGLVRQIVSLSDGNPLVAMETIQDLIDEGALDVSADHWKLTTQGKVRLPDSVESLFTSRLKHLSKPQRKALEVAAVANASLTSKLFSHALGGDLNTDDLDELIERGWLCESRETEGEFRFVQSGVAETIYRSLPPGRRRDLHKAVAEHIENLSGNARQKMAARLALHYEAIGSFSRALLESEKAAIRASRLLAFEEARENFALAMSSLDRIPEDELEESKRAATALRIGHRLLYQQILSGHLESAVASGESLCLYPNDILTNESQEHLALVEAGRGRALEQLGRFSEALSAFESSDAIARGLQDAPLTRLWAATGKAGAHLKLGESGKAAEMLEAAIAEAKTTNEMDRSSMEALCRAYRVLGNAKVRLKEFDAAKPWYDRAENLASTGGLPSEIVDALNGLAACHYFKGSIAEATTTWEKALKVAENWDLVQHRAVLLGNLGELALSAGEMERAAQLLRRAEALHEHLRSDEGIAECAHLLAQCLRAEESWSDAESAYRRSLDAALRSTSHRHQAQAQLGLAEVLEKRWPRDTRTDTQGLEITSVYSASAKSYEASRDMDSAKRIRAHLREHQT
jgi:serine/threonine-protein kinase